MLNLHHSGWMFLGFERNGDVSPLADRQCVSAHFSCGPLTFNINGEIIISSSAGAALPRNVEVVLASLRIYSSLEVTLIRALAVDGRKECLGIELAEFLRYCHECHDWPPLPEVRSRFDAAKAKGH